MCLAAAVTPAVGAYEYPTKRPTVQPGSSIFVPDDGGRCTLGFLARDAAGAVYGLSWGNCPADVPGSGGQATVRFGTEFYGERSWVAGKGPIVKGYDPRIRPIGRFVLQVSRPDNDHLQYSVLRLDKGVVYNATVGVTGGPTPKPFGGSDPLPTALAAVGHDGYLTDFAVGPQGYDDGYRSVLAYDGLRPVSFRLATAATLDQGGAPVVLMPGDGAPIAVGILAGRTGTGGTVGNEDGRAAGSVVYRLDAVLTDASKKLGRRLTLLASGAQGRTRA